MIENIDPERREQILESCRLMAKSVKLLDTPDADPAAVQMLKQSMSQVFGIPVEFLQRIRAHNAGEITIEALANELGEAVKKKSGEAN